MDDQRFPADVLGVDACRIGKPVVGMDDVELLLACNDTGHDGVVVDFVLKVFGVAS